MANYTTLHAKQFPPIKLYIALTLAFIIIVYGLYEAHNLLLGPTLEVATPSSGQVVHDSFIEIKGSTRRIAKIFLNGRQIFTKSDGSFNEPLILAYGYNIIGVKVEDQFGRRITKNLEVVLN